MSSCVICEKGGGKLIVVTDRGKESLKKFAKLRQDERVLKYVEQGEQCAVHEHESSVKSVSEFKIKMKEFLDEKEPYGSFYIKQLLREKYGSCVIIKPRGTGQADLITFVELTQRTLNSKSLLCL